MKKKLLIALVVFLAVIGGIVGYAAIQPAEYHVERTATMNASPEVVFDQVNNFHNWEKWSPWAKLDPNAKSVFEGPESGEGAVFKWSGNSDVGEGSMTITENKPHERVGIQLHFIKPFEDTADVAFVIRPEGEKSQVTWSMSGKNNLMGRVMCLFMNMDKMIGGQYEEGLKSIKQIVEKPAAPKEAATDTTNDEPEAASKPE